MRVISVEVDSLASSLRWSVKTSIFLIFCIFIYLFSAAQAAKNLRDVYGEEALKDRQCRNWFDKFRSGDFSLKDEQCSGRPNEDDDQIKAIIESDDHVIVVEIKEMIKIPKSTIDRHIKCLGLVKKLYFLILHEFKKIHLTERINACDLHFKRNEFNPFLKRIITGGEKWIVYNNVIRKWQWFKRDEPPQTTPKAELREKKIMLSFWWDWKGVVFFELLPRNQAIDLYVYCRQLNEMNTVVKEKRSEFVNRKSVIFHHDNATLHTSLATRQKLLRLG